MLGRTFDTLIISTKLRNRLIAFATFSMAVFIGAMIVIMQKPTILLVGAIGGAVIVLIAFKYMWVALTLLIATSSTLGITLNSGSSTPLPFNLVFLSLLLGIWLLRMAMLERKIYLLPSSINTPFIAFVLSAVFSWILGYAIWDWRIPVKSNLVLVQAGQVGIFAFSIAATLLVANHPTKENHLKWWSAILIAIGIGNLLYGFWIKNPKPFPYVDGSVLMWPILLIWAQVLFNPNLSYWYRLGGGVVTCAWGYWIWTGTLAWKGGWVPALIGLCILLWFKSRRVFLIMAVLGGLVLFAGRGWISENILSGEQSTGSTIRPLYWLDVIRMTSRSPIFGLGPANYEFYWQDPTFIPYSRIASGWDTWIAWGYSPPSHNMFVDIYSQTGLAGLVFFTWGVIAGLRICFRVIQNLSPGFGKAYTLGVFAGLVSLLISSFMFADWLLPYVYNITISGFAHSVYSWILLGSVIALDHSMKGAKNELAA